MCRKHYWYRKLCTKVAMIIVPILGLPTAPQSSLGRGTISVDSPETRGHFSTGPSRTLSLYSVSAKSVLKFREILILPSLPHVWLGSSTQNILPLSISATSPYSFSFYHVLVTATAIWTWNPHVSIPNSWKCWRHQSPSSVSSHFRSHFYAKAVRF